MSPFKNVLSIVIIIFGAAIFVLMFFKTQLAINGLEKYKLHALEETKQIELVIKDMEDELEKFKRESGSGEEMAAEIQARLAMLEFQKNKLTVSKGVGPNSDSAIKVYGWLRIVSFASGLLLIGVGLWMRKKPKHAASP